LPTLHKRAPCAAAKGRGAKKLGGDFEVRRWTDSKPEVDREFPYRVKPVPPSGINRGFACSLKVQCLAVTLEGPAIIFDVFPSRIKIGTVLDGKPEWRGDVRNCLFQLQQLITGYFHHDGVVPKLDGKLDDWANLAFGTPVAVLRFAVVEESLQDFR
jgi:hypothetical protein